MHDFFTRFSGKASKAVGSSVAFVTALILLLTWGISGPIFGFSDSWQLIINTGTTIVTFLMVFLIQNTQNRDAHAMHLKLDEIIRAHKGSRNKFIDAEQLTDDELEQLHADLTRVVTNRRSKRKE